MKRVTVTLADSLTLVRWILGVLAVFVLFTLLFNTISNGNATDRNHETGLENNTYLRIETCLDSIPDEQQTDDYISNCYLKAELHNHVKVDHFGNK